MCVWASSFRFTTLSLSKYLLIRLLMIIANLYCKKFVSFVIERVIQPYIQSLFQVTMFIAAHRPIFTESHITESHLDKDKSDCIFAEKASPMFYCLHSSQQFEEDKQAQQFSCGIFVLYATWTLQEDVSIRNTKPYLATEPAVD